VANSHSRKWEFGVLRDSQKLRRRFEEPKHLALKCSLYHWKGLEVLMFKITSHSWFGHLQSKLWAKKGPGVKVAVWLLTTKSRESTSSRCPIREFDTSLERSWRGLQDWFRPRRDQTLQSGVMSFQSLGTPPGTISGLHPNGTNSHGASQSILYGGWWWHPPSPGRGVSCDPKCPWLVPTLKGVPECELTTWVVCFDADSCLIN
jgi:hypothetical protein